MTGMVEVAAKVAASVAIAMRISQPLVSSEIGRLHYDVRASAYGSGLGGSSPTCAPQGKDMLLLVYLVTNNYDIIKKSPQVPTLALVDPNGAVLRPDPALSNLVSMGATPPMIFPNGQMEGHQTLARAEVFLPPQGDLQRRAYRLRIDAYGQDNVPLPPPTLIPVPQCSRASPIQGIEDVQR